MSAAPHAKWERDSAPPGTARSPPTRRSERVDRKINPVPNRWPRMSVVKLFEQIAENEFGFFRQIRVVADVMTGDPKTLTLDDNYEMARDLLRRGGFHHAPVIDPEDGRIVGIVSDRDLLRAFPRTLGTGAERDNDRTILSESVTRFMSRQPVWCTAGSSVVWAMSLMLVHHVDCVLVSPDGMKLQGILTPRDLVRTLLVYHRVCSSHGELKRLRLVDLDLKNGVPLDEIYVRGAQTARDVMTKSVETVRQDDSVAIAMHRMQDLEVRHLPVVDNEGRYVGLLSDREILAYLPFPHVRPHTPEKHFRQTLFSGADPEQIRTDRVGSLVNPGAPTAAPDTLLTDLLKVFLERPVGGVTVLESEKGPICGVLTISDVLRVLRVVMQIGGFSEPVEAIPVATASRQRAPVS